MVILWLIFVILYIYISISIICFEWFSKRDYFCERHLIFTSFPKKTFWSSVFWIFSIPKILIGLLIEEISCTITAHFVANYEREERKRKERRD